MRKLLLIVATAAFAAACTPASTGPDDDVPTTTAGDVTTTAYTGESFAGTVDAPEFPDGLEWINTSGPLTMNALKGKVVLLDFWTYGCINCIHIIPDLERLEEEFPDELVVVGVHSAKFPNEGRTGNLEDIVQRYGIAHAVVNDKDFAIWNAWGANAWPTVALVDPAGKAVGVRAGEGVYDAVQPVIAGLVAEFDAQQAINRTAIALAPEADTAPLRPLSYPGKVIADGSHIWIADTGHNRIVEVDPDTGDVLAVYGSGQRGSDDGPALEATFDAPQGMAVHDGTLYVADTDNHLIRAVDLGSGEVSTIAGTGEQGWPPESGAARDVALSNPWALALDDGTLFVANAGTHQIWSMDLALGTVGPLVGSAREGTANGAFDDAELAQPSGLTLDGDRRLFFADSESSSIRVADLDTGETFLVVGGDADLFSFGDEDGQLGDARLQHPLGVAYADGIVYVADTYNSKIKRIDVATSTVTSWLGGDPGWSDGANPQFNEPGGLFVSGDLLYVADTNNHAIRIVDRETGATTTLVLKGIEAFDPPTAFNGEVVKLQPVEVTVGRVDLTFDYHLPEGYKVNEDAPSSVVVGGPGTIVSLADPLAGDLTGTSLPTTRSLTTATGEATATFDVTLIYCAEEATSLCLIDRIRFEQPLVVRTGASGSTIVLTRTIPTPDQ